MSIKSISLHQKVSLTPLLKNTIKTLRKERNKRGDIISKQLGKGASYISQIENNKIKEIEFDTVMKIFQTILDMSGTPYINYMCNRIKAIIAETSQKQLVQENWIHIFLAQELSYDIDVWVVSFTDNKLEELQISPEELVKKINKNSILQQFSDKGNILIPNKAYVYVAHIDYYSENEYDFNISVKYMLPYDYLSNILTRKITTINYINMYAIFENLFLEESNHIITSDIYEKTKKIMYDNGFYNTYDFYNNIHHHKSRIDNALYDDEYNNENTNSFTFYDNLIVDYEKKYNSEKDKLFKKLDFSLLQYYENNSAYSCEVIDKMLHNLVEDPGLMMAILSAPLYDLPNYNRRKFFKEFSLLLEKYSNSSDY